MLPSKESVDMAEEKVKLKKYWVEQAINLAMQGRWAEAVTANQNIIALFPADAEAWNRLGKAYTELGQYEDAREAYARAVQIDPSNSIAQKNLQKLSFLLQASHGKPRKERIPPREGETDRIEPYFFVEETGKTGVTNLVNPAPLDVLAKLTAGDPLRLRVNGYTLVVESPRGERLGEVESKLGQRIIGFMKAGNKYSAAVAALDNNTVRVIIRETYQHPSMAGRVSFPSKGEASGFRAYIKESVLRYDLEEEEEAGEEIDYGLEPEAAAEELGEEIEPSTEEEL